MCDSRTGKEVVEYHRSARKHIAVKIKEARQQLKAYFLLVDSESIRSINEFVRRRFSKVPFKPTAENFRQAATDAFEFAQAPISSRGSEYYSCCGLEDVAGETKDYALVQAIEYFRAWKYMKGIEQ